LEEESEDTYDLIGQRAREQRDKSVASWRRGRIAGLVDAISSGVVKAPQSVLKALEEALFPKPQDSAHDKMGGQPEQEKPASPTASAGSDIDVLAQFFKSGSWEERIGAASCIAYSVKTFSASPGPDFRPVRLYLKDETPALLRGALTAASSDEIPEVQRDLLNAFTILKFGGDELFPVFRRLFSAPHAEVRVAAIFAIRTFGIDRAAGTIKDFIGLLADPMKDVRLAVCDTLVWLGPDAVQAIPALLDRVRADREPDVELAAARALTVIDPSGMELLKVSDRATRDALIEGLRQLDKVGRTLRRLLLPLWIEADRRAAEKPVRRMKPIEIAHTLDCDSKTVRRMIERKELHILGQEGQKRSLVYLVTDEEVERIKAARLGNTH
jgi:hypothetical protein